MTERFNRLAKEWDSKPMRVEGAMTFVDNIIKSISCDIKSFDILDYGCGSGLVSFGFADKVKSIKGLDNSIGMVEVYNEKAKLIGFSNINAELHDINTESLNENQYDLIVTNMTMHHIKDTKMFIEKLSLALKPNGYLFIADLVSEDGKFHSDNEGVEHFGFSMDLIQELFINAGLSEVSIEVMHTIEKPHNNYDVFIVKGTKAVIVSAGNQETFPFATPIGIGLIDSAINLTRICLFDRPEYIVFIGSAGSYGKHDILDIVEASASSNLELSFLCDDAYTPIDNVVKCEKNLAKNDIIINSSNYISTNQELSKEYLKYGISLENMEFYSVLKVAKEFDIDVLGIFVVTNFTNKTAHQDFIKNHDMAMDKLTSYLVEKN